MNKINYNKVMNTQISSFTGKKKLLLHSCCGPCSTFPIPLLKHFFDLTVFYYNPNIFPKEDFNLRVESQKKVCDHFGVELVVLEGNERDFYNCIKGLEMEKEGGLRCEKCFYLRLKKTQEFATLNGFDFFTTTLTVSPLKNEQLINEIGKQLEQEEGAKFLHSDFKKGGGFLNTVKMSNELSLYRQNYCGCVYSQK